MDSQLRRCFVASASFLPRAVGSACLLIGALVLGVGLSIAEPSDDGAGDAWDRSLRAEDLRAIESLLGPDVDPDRAARHGRTALMLAARDAETSLVVRLISAGADVNARNDNGGTPLMYGAIGGDADIGQRLIEAGAEVNAVARFEWTAMMVAAAKGHAGYLDILMQAGADPNARDAYGWTPLMRAVLGGHEQAVACLLKVPSIDLELRGESGATALHIAAAGGNANIVRSLLDRGSDPAATDEDDRTPAQFASQAGHHSLESLLSQTEKGR